MNAYLTFNKLLGEDFNASDYISFSGTAAFKIQLCLYFITTGPEWMFLGRLKELHIALFPPSNLTVYSPGAGWEYKSCPTYVDPNGYRYLSYEDYQYNYGHFWYKLVNNEWTYHGVDADLTELFLNSLSTYWYNWLGSASFSPDINKYLAKDCVYWHDINNNPYICYDMDGVNWFYEQSDYGSNFIYQYKRDRDEDWQTLTTLYYRSSDPLNTIKAMTGNFVEVNANEVISFKTNYTKFYTEPISSKFVNFNISGTNQKVVVFGNLVNLIDGKNPSYRVFNHLLWNNSALSSAKKLVFPDVVDEECYYAMFQKCSYLSESPVLPAKVMAPGCYSHMFEYTNMWTSPPLLPATTLANCCYQAMFKNCLNLVNPPVLSVEKLAPSCYCEMYMYDRNLLSSATTQYILSSTTLAEGCYAQMFAGCTKVPTAYFPELPATNLPSYCYQLMFSGCTQIITAIPFTCNTVGAHSCEGMFANCTSMTTATNNTVLRLRATVLSSHCYSRMFENCYKLTTAPSLSAKDTADYCYANMFAYCSSLVNVPALPATGIAPYCYQGMFQYCYSMTTMPTLPAKRLAEYCYNEMFFWCRGLTQIGTGKMSGTILALNCYSSMFNCCINLKTIHQNNCFSGIHNGILWSFASMFAWCSSLTGLPTNFLSNMSGLGQYCCKHMFQGCTALTAGPTSIPATIAEDGCYLGMFQGCTSLLSAFPLMAFDANHAGNGCYADMFTNCSSLKAISSYVDAWEKTIGGTTIPFTCGTLVDPDNGDQTWNSWVSGVPTVGTYYYNPNLPAAQRIKANGDYVHIPYNWNLVQLDISTIPEEDQYFIDGGLLDYTSPSPREDTNKYIPVPNTNYGRLTITRWHGANYRYFNNGTKFFKDYNNTTYSIVNNIMTNGENFFTGSNSNAGVRVEELPDVPPFIIYALNDTQDFYVYISGGTGESVWAIYVDDYDADTEFGTGTGLGKHLRGAYLTNGTKGYKINKKQSSPSRPAQLARIYNIGENLCVKNHSVKIWTMPLNVKVGISGQFTGLTGQLLSAAADKKLYSYEFYNLFKGWKALTQIADTVVLPYSVISNADTIPAYCFSAMFAGCTNLSSLPNWNSTLGSNSLSTAEYAFNGMFSGCTGLRDVGLKNKTGSSRYYLSHLYATNLSTCAYANMFKNCRLLSTVYFTQNANSLASATSCFFSMFYGCNALTNSSNSISLNHINCQAGWYKQMFAGCSSLDISPTFTNENILNCPEHCFEGMFKNCYSLVTVPQLNKIIATGNVFTSGYAGMFQWCSELNLGFSYDTDAYGYDIEEEFIEDPNGYGPISFDNVTFIFNTSYVEDYGFRNMFEGCSNLIIAPILNANVESPRAFQEMFQNCYKLKYLINTSNDSNAYGEYWLNGISTNGKYFTITVNNAQYLPDNWRIRIIPS